MTLNRGIRSAAAVGLALAAMSGAPARAQYYPGGYGGYGWGGWGGGGGGGTVQGDTARGLGVFAQGAGVYNLDTAQARSINTDTAMRWNQYVYDSTMESGRQMRANEARRLNNNVNAQAAILKRLRDNPNQNDIYRGDALNAAKDEIDNPTIFGSTLRAAKAKVGGESIRNIPFQYATAAISTSVHDLVKDGPPPLLKDPKFDKERGQLKEVVASIRKQTDAGAAPNPADLAKAREILKALRVKFEATTPKDAFGYSDAEKYLKAATGLTRMLEGPSLNVILSGVEKRPDATLSELLSFMNAFNLRFGPATTPEQREIYDNLYPMLVNVRKEVAPLLAGANAAAAGTKNHAHAGEFFSGMKFDDLENVPPPPPAPTPAKP